MTSWLNSIRIVAIIIALVITAVSPAAAQEDQATKEELEATIAALQTQAAELEPETTGTPASTPTAAGKWNTASVAGNGFEVLTPAPAGTVDVVATGTYDGHRLPFVVHNNTDTAIEDVSVEGTVLDAAGGLFAVGGDLLGTTPGWIEPGAVGLGYLYFEGITFPDGATVDMTVSYEAAETRSSFGTLEATIADFSKVEDRFVGFLANPHSTAISGPLSVSVMCLAQDGSIRSYNEGYTESDTIPVGSQIPFQVTLDPVFCDYSLISAQGYNF